MPVDNLKDQLNIQNLMQQQQKLQQQQLQQQQLQQQLQLQQQQQQKQHAVPDYLQQKQQQEAYLNRLLMKQALQTSLQQQQQQQQQAQDPAILNALSTQSKPIWGDTSTCMSPDSEDSFKLQFIQSIFCFKQIK